MLEAIILAAGEGRRMNSRHPKVLQPVGGRPMLSRLIDTVEALGVDRIHVVVGAGGDQVRTALDGRGCRFVDQHQRLGTGHAAAQALPDLDPSARVLVLPGDMPLVRPATLARLTALSADLALLSFRADDPTGYGRILRADSGQVVAIREQRDASPQERTIDEVNSGVLCARAAQLADWISRLTPDNAQGEFYLTDCIALAAEQGHSVQALIADSAAELLGANDRVQLATLEAEFQRRARQALMEAGATLADPASVTVRGEVQIGRDVFIDARVTLIGPVDLGDEVRVGPGCVIEDSRLAAGTRLKPYCVLEGVLTTGACELGPFARLRAGTELAAGVKIGNFVETKKARLAAGAKASHLSYLGNVEIGEQANIGAGTITCNYDGVNKHPTVIGAGAFIGSNSSLVAPVEVGAEATLGAGTVLTRSAPAGELTIARVRQRTIEGWQRPDPASRDD